MNPEHEESHREINSSLEQAEVWLLEEPDTELAKTHMLDALDEMNYQLNLLES